MDTASDGGGRRWRDGCGHIGSDNWCAIAVVIVGVRRLDVSGLN